MFITACYFTVELQKWLSAVNQPQGPFEIEILNHSLFKSNNNNDKDDDNKNNDTNNITTTTNNDN